MSFSLQTLFIFTQGDVFLREAGKLQEESVSIIDSGYYLKKKKRKEKEMETTKD